MSQQNQPQNQSRAAAQQQRQPSSSQPQRRTQPERQHVVVTDVDISFGNMVGLLIKLAFASIPAAIIIWIVFGILGAIFMSVLGVGGAMLGAG
ncbi:MAG: hypothetical protein ACOCV2_14045 [Persicimonas sp.]